MLDGKRYIALDTLLIKSNLPVRLEQPRRPNRRSQSLSFIQNSAVLNLTAPVKNRIAVSVNLFVYRIPLYRVDGQVITIHELFTA